MPIIRLLAGTLRMTGLPPLPRGHRRRSPETAKKKIAPPPDEKAVVAALASKDHTEYDRLRAGVAETFGVRVGTLDDKVEALRKKRRRRTIRTCCHTGRSSRGLS